MAKELPQLHWIEDLLPKGCIRKSMFGGFAYYFQNHLVLVMFESNGNKTHKNKKYKFELWNGCMFPAEKEYHSVLLKRHSYLINHPVLPKWLYLPQETEDFETNVEYVLKEIRGRNAMFGVIPKPKKTIKKVKIEDSEKIDTRRPRMFGDEPAEVKLKSVQKLTDFKNLGPATEQTFLKAGIKTPQQFIKLGWKETMRKLVQVNSKNSHSLFAYAVIGALKNQDWNKIAEADKLEAREFMKKLREQRAKKR